MLNNVNRVHGGASNIKTGTNPPFTLQNLYDVYPQFGAGVDGKHIVPINVMEMYLNLADASMNKRRWCNSWEIGMCLFIAHFLTLYAQSISDPESGASGIIEAGKAKGLDTSMSVDGISVSTDYGALAEGVSGWASWRATVFGQQLTALGRLYGKGMMVIP